MIGQRFTVAKRRVAMFCVALCMGLSAQMTIVVLDRAKHTFQIDHAPNGLAGAVFDHGHHLDVDVQHSPDRGHEDDHHVAVVHGHDDHDVQRVADHAHPHGDDAAPPLATTRMATTRRPPMATCMPTTTPALAPLITRTMVFPRDTITARSRITTTAAAC